jgi:hypothetical protein
MRRCVWSRNLVNEDALPHWELLHPKQTNKMGSINLIRQMGKMRHDFYVKK